MNMDYYQMTTEADNRRHTLLKEADRNRLADQARQATKNGHLHNLRNAALYRLGTFLTRWGDSLQVRYDATEIEPIPLLYER